MANVTGQSTDVNVAGVVGINTVAGSGLFGTSKDGEGIHGENNSDTLAAIAGIAKSASGTGAGVFGESQGKGEGVLGVSALSEGVRGEGHSLASAGVSGLALNPNGTGAGVFGESKGKGEGVLGVSALSEGVRGEGHSLASAGVSGLALNPNGTGAGVFGESQGKGEGVLGVSALSEGVRGEGHSLASAGVSGLALNPNGTGAGVFGESKGKGPAGFFRGDVLVTGDIKLTDGADCAEDFDISSAEQIEPGTVMVLNQEGVLQRSQQPYDKRVAGVISGAGGYKPGIVLDRQEMRANRLPVALLGKVYCKVDAQFGAIEVGDLLTTSATPGHAMKAGDPIRAFGTVIGKALRPLHEGQGLIPVLVALQ